MSDPNNSDTTVSEAEKIAAEVALAYARNGYVTDGEPDRELLVEKVFGIVSRAVVNATPERKEKAVIRPKLMASVFPDVPGPEAWDEQEDPQIAAKVYAELSTAVWRLTDPNYTGPVQSRLNGETGMILCRTKATVGMQWGVYVTQDVECLRIDFSGPFKAKLEADAKKHTLNLAMATSRLPQFSKVWESELRKGLAQAKKTSDAALYPALSAVRNGEDD